MKAKDAAALIVDIAVEQWGLFSAAQAAAAGVHGPELRRLHNSGRISRIRHGIYALEGISFDAYLDLRAEWIALAPEQLVDARLNDAQAIISHTTAATAWQIGDLWENGYHFTVPAFRRTRQPLVKFHTRKLARAQWEIHPDLGLPITTARQTIIDLANDNNEESHILDLIRDAAERGLITRSDMEVDCAAHPNLHFAQPKLGQIFGK